MYIFIYIHNTNIYIFNWNIYSNLFICLYLVCIYLCSFNYNKKYKYLYKSDIYIN